MRQELLKLLRTNSLDGIALKSMHILTAKDKISVYCANGTRLVVWYLTKVVDEFDDPNIQVDAVKAVEGRVGSGNINALIPVFTNPLNTKEPTVYLATSSGLVYLYLPTTKNASVSKVPLLFLSSLSSSLYPSLLPPFPPFLPLSSFLSLPPSLPNMNMNRMENG